MKNAFYFMLKVFFVLEIFKFLWWLFGYIEKRFDKKVKVNFKFQISKVSVTDDTANTCNTHTAQCFKK